MRKSIIACFFLFGFMMVGWAKANPDKEASAYLSSVQAEDRIAYLYELCLKRNGDSTVFGYIDLLKQEAEKAGNNNMVAQAMALRVQSFSNQNRMDSVMKYADSAINALRKVKDYDRMFITQNVIIGRLIFNLQYTLALERIKKQYDEAKALNNTVGLAMANKNFGQMYHYTGRFQEALRFYHESLDILEKSNKTSLIVDLYLEMIIVNQEQHNNEEALKDCDACFAILADIAQNHKIINENTLHGQLFTFYCIKACILLKENRVQEAKECLDKADAMVDPLWSGVWLYPLWGAKIRYYIRVENYKEALKYYNKHAEVSSKDILKTNFFLANCKAQIEKGLGRYKEASELYAYLLAASDSLSNISRAKQLDEIRVLYEVDRLEMQAEKDKMHITLILLGVVVLVVICLLLGTILLIVRRSAKKLKEKNRSLFLQLKEKDKLQARIRKLTVTAGEEERKENTSLKLFIRLQEWMEENKSYISPDINLKDVAGQLSTNTRYLGEAIRNATGQTFNDYVNTLRLEYAKVLILSENMDYMTIEGIAIEAGFGTRSNFYRLFRAKYGLTPSELRKQKEEEHT